MKNVYTFFANGYNKVCLVTRQLKYPLVMQTLIFGTFSLFVTYCLMAGTYSFAQGNWAQKTNFDGTARGYSAGFSIGTKGYIGTGSDGTVKKDFWEWDQATNVWTQKANFGGAARSGAVGFSIGTKGYIGTGFDDNNYYKDFWEWDQLTNAWTPKTDFGGTACRNAVGFSIGAKGYIGTGNDGTPKKDFWEWDQLTNAWTPKTDFGGTARLGAVGFSIGTKGYIGTGNDGVAKKDFWEWDQTNDTWTQKTDFGGTARYFAVGFSICTRGYIGTGNDGVAKKDFWEWDQTNGTWTQKTNFSGTARFYATGFSIGNRGYIGTGYDGINKQDFWEYNPSTLILTSATTSVSCNGGSDGTAIVSVAGVSPPYTYEWSTTPVQSTQTATGLTTGIYYITVLDSNNCQETIGDTITQPTALILSVASTQIECNGPYLGSAGTTVNGGSPSYSFQWSNLNSSEDISNLVPGTYYVTVTDSKGCSKTDTAIIDNPPVCGNWLQRANFGGVGRFGTVGFSIGDKGYIGTGWNGGYLKDFWEWDQTNNVWTQKADFGGSARWGAVCFSISAKGYIGTGYDGNYTKDFWEWDQTNNSWSQKTNFAGAARMGAVGFSIGTKGYIGTGYDDTLKKDFWHWDQTTDIWLQKANFSGSARYNTVGFSIGTKGYIGTGWDGSLKKDFWEYTQDTFDTLGGGSWSSKTSFGGSARYNAVGFSIGTKGYIGTGYDGDYTRDFWEWDQANNSWKQKTNFSGTPRYLAVGFSIGTKGYIGTGHDGNMKQDFWEYDSLLSTIAELKNPSYIYIYPNPSNGMITLKVGSQMVENGIVDIYNVLGEKVYSTSNLKPQTSNDIDLHYQPDGIYFLKIRTEIEQQTHKLIILR